MRRVAWIVLLAAAQPAAAQTIRGTVADSASSTPLGSVTVELLRLDSQLVERGQTDSAGTFTVRAPDPGRYFLRVQMIGYRPYQTAIALTSRGETNLAIRLGAVPVALPAVTVEASRDAYLLRRGFYMRKESERGNFLDPGQVEKVLPKAKVATDLLLKIPGVRIQQGVPQLRTCRTVTSGSSQDAMDITGFPHVYVDGVKSGREIAYFMQPQEILAVEVYMGPSQIPLQYGGTSTPCGVILIWTKQ